MHAVLPSTTCSFVGLLCCRTGCPMIFENFCFTPTVTKLLRAHGELRVNKSLRYTGPHCGVRTDRQTRETFLGRSLRSFPRYCTTYATPQVIAQLRMTRFAWHNGLSLFVPSFPAQYGHVMSFRMFEWALVVLSLPASYGHVRM